MVDSYGENQSYSSSSNQEGGQKSHGTNMNYAQSGRALLRPEEILSLDESYLIAFLRGTHPILAKRVKWYNDPEFNHSATGTRSGRWWMSVKLWWAILVAVLFLLAWMNR